MGRKPLRQRHDMNIPSSENDEEFFVVVLAVGVSKDIPTHLLYSFAPRQSQTMLQFWWESSIQDLSTMNGKHTSKGGDMKSLQSRPTSVRMELNAPFSQEWAFCIDDTSLLSPLAARWFGIIPPSTVVTDFLSGNTMTFFLDYSVPPCRP